MFSFSNKKVSCQTLKCNSIIAFSIDIADAIANFYMVSILMNVIFVRMVIFQICYFYQKTSKTISNKNLITDSFLVTPNCKKVSMKYLFLFCTLYWKRKCWPKGPKIFTIIIKMFYTGKIIRVPNITFCAPNVLWCCFKKNN